MRVPIVASMRTIPSVGGCPSNNVRLSWEQGSIRVVCGREESRRPLRFVFSEVPQSYRNAQPAFTGGFNLKTRLPPAG
jgi:hypothetical protein